MSEADAHRTIDVVCQSCNIQVSATVVATHEKSIRTYRNSDPEDDFYDVTEYALVVCGKMRIRISRGVRVSCGRRGFGSSGRAHLISDEPTDFD